MQNRPRGNLPILPKGAIWYFFTEGQLGPMRIGRDEPEYDRDETFIEMIERLSRECGGRSFG